jgi:excinuclease ABC subunit A
MAVDVVAAESRRRFSQSLAGSERLSAGSVARIAAEEITGLPPAVLLRSATRGDLSVGEYLAVDDLLAQLFCAHADIHCLQCQAVCRSFSVDQAVLEITRMEPGEGLLVIGSLELQGNASLEATLSELKRAGYRRIRTGGRVTRLEEESAVAAQMRESGGSLQVVVDRLTVKVGEEGRIAEAIRSARAIGRGRSLVVTGSGEGDELWLNHQLTCTQCGADYGHLSGGDFTTLGPGSQEPSPASSAILVDTTFGELTGMTLDEVRRYAAALESQDWGEQSAPAQSTALIQALRQHLGAACTLLVGHLPLARSMRDLSGGEHMRLVVATYLTRGLVGVLYIIPLPLSVLDAEARAAVLKALRTLVVAGNSVILVDNDPGVMMACDTVVHFVEGKAATIRNSSVAETDVADADRNECQALSHTGTGEGAPSSHRAGQRFLCIRSSGGGPGNLEELDLDVPLEQLVVVGGISGAGKTSLIRGLLLSGLNGGRRQRRGSAEGKNPIETQADGIRRVVDLSEPARGLGEQETVMGTLGLFPPVARLYAESATDRGLTFPAEWFQLDGAGGRCTTCAGRGRLDCELEFMEDLSLLCPACEGRRFKAEILAVTRRGISIADVLALSVGEATQHFSAHRRIASRLEGGRSCGLEMLRLGTVSSELEPGELLRLRLATEVSRASGKDLLVLDHAAAGCHADDLSLLLSILRGLVDAGASILLADGTPALSGRADWVVQLGPGRGSEGGRIVFQGPPGTASTGGHPPTAGTSAG